MKAVWCVAWRAKRPGDAPMCFSGCEWCATYRGRKPSIDAVSDRTRCGAWVTLRVGSEKRKPTCAECNKRIAGARKARTK